MDYNYLPYLDDRMSATLSSTAELERARKAMKLRKAQEKYEKAIRKYTYPYYETMGTGSPVAPMPKVKKSKNLPLPGSIITPKQYKKIIKRATKTQTGEGIIARGIAARGISARGPILSIIGALAKPLISKGIKALAKKIKQRKLKRKAMNNIVPPTTVSGEGIWSSAAKTAMKILSKKYGQPGMKHLKARLKEALGKEYSKRILSDVPAGKPAETYKDLMEPLIKARVTEEDSNQFFMPKGWNKPIEGKGLRDKLKKLMKKGLKFVKSSVAPLAIKAVAELVKSKVSPEVGSMVDTISEKAIDVIKPKEEAAKAKESVTTETTVKPKKKKKTVVEEEALVLPEGTTNAVKLPMDGGTVRRNKPMNNVIYKGTGVSSADIANEELLSIPVYKTAKNMGSPQ